MITAESIRKTVESRLAEMVESRHEYLKHGDFLSSLGIAVRNNLTLHHCLENVFAHYLDVLCGKLSQENADGTPAKIAVDPVFISYSLTAIKEIKRYANFFFNTKTAIWNPIRP